MSVNAGRSESRLTPRALRIRNRCLAILAARRALPIPSDAETAELGDGIGLDQAFGNWERRHTPPTSVTHVSAQAMAWWRSPRYARVSVGVSVLAIGVVLAFRGLATRAGAQPAPVQWLAVNDSVTAGARTKLRRLSVGDSLALSANDVAAMLFDAAPPRRTKTLDSLEARLDSTLEIRGRVHDAFRLELGGQLYLVRSRLVALRVTRLVVDGSEIPAASVAPYLRSIAPYVRRSVAGEMLFDLRSPISAMRLEGDRLLVVGGRQ